MNRCRFSVSRAQKVRQHLHFNCLYLFTKKSGRRLPRDEETITPRRRCVAVSPGICRVASPGPDTTEIMAKLSEVFGRPTLADALSQCADYQDLFGYERRDEARGRAVKLACMHARRLVTSEEEAMRLLSNEVNNSFKIIFSTYC